MSTGPLRAVLAEVDGGALTLTEIAGRTGLSMDMVRTSLEQLVRMGLLSTEAMTAACPPAGCGSCAVSPTATCSTGPVLVGLSRTRAG